MMQNDSQRIIRLVLDQKTVGRSCLAVADPEVRAVSLARWNWVVGVDQHADAGGLGGLVHLDEFFVVEQSLTPSRPRWWRSTPQRTSN